MSTKVDHCIGCDSNEHRLAVRTPPTCQRCYLKEWTKKNRSKSNNYKADWKQRNPEANQTINAAWAAAHRADRYQSHVAYLERNPSYKLWRAAKRRAKLGNFPFTIDPADIVFPTNCPLCSRLLISRQGQSGRQSVSSPTVDRLIPALGYAKGNVWILCHGCNSSKNNASPAFMVAVLSEIKKRGLLPAALTGQLIQIAAA